jgi:predicted nuclease of predicted toxin-antitoxin system
MRFKVDENLPVEVVQLLCEAGQEATTVLDQHLGGSRDATVATICYQEWRALVTLDRDFAAIRTYRATLLGFAPKTLCRPCSSIVA